MSRQYAVKDRDGSIHEEPDYRQAVREWNSTFGGVVVSRENAEEAWEPYKRPVFPRVFSRMSFPRVFLWVFLAVQVGFIGIIVWAIATTPDVSSAAAAEAQFWTGFLLIGLVVWWVIVDVVLAVIYGLYRAATRRQRHAT